MLSKSEVLMIREMRKKGMYISHIAKIMGRDRKTIRKWLQKEGDKNKE